MLKSAERQLALAVRLNSELGHTSGKTSSRVKFTSLMEGWAWQFGLLKDAPPLAASAVVADSTSTSPSSPSPPSSSSAAAAADPIGVSRMYRRVTQYWEVRGDALAWMPLCVCAMG